MGMALYVGADHVVWAASARIFADENAKARGDFFQKLSLWSWFAASVASVLTQTSDLTKALDEMSALKEDVVEDDDGKKSKNDDDKKAAKKDRLEKQRAAAAHARAHMRLHLQVIMKQHDEDLKRMHPSDAARFAKQARAPPAYL